MNAQQWKREQYPSELSAAVLGPRAPYRLGRLDRATAGYQPDIYSGDSASQAAHDLMHRRTRDQRRNNPHIRKAVEALQDLIIGSGVQTLADPFEPWMDLVGSTPSDFDERVSYAIESDDLYDEWFGDPKAFSADGRLDGMSFQRMVIGECATVGQCFILESFRKVERGKVGLCYQLTEADCLDRTKCRQKTATQNRIVDGIELDASGREVAFWMFTEHPSDSFVVQGESQRFTADRCWHIMLPDRPTQHLGVTWLHASGQPEIDRDQYVTAELAAAKKAAALSMVWKKNNPYGANLGLLSTEPESDDDGNRQIRLGTSPVAAVIGPEEDVKIVESNRPNAGAAPFLQILDRYSAAGIGLSYYTLTGDYASTNFSSVRAAKLDEDGHVRPLQNWFGSQVALPIRRRFNAVAAALGMFTTITPSEFAANVRRYQRFDAMGPGRDLLDPDSETNAAISRLRAGLSTLKIECAKRGLHWIRVMRQAKLENQLATILGVKLDFSKGNGGQTTGNTREQGAATSA